MFFLPYVINIILCLLFVGNCLYEFLVAVRKQNSPLGRVASWRIWGPRVRSGCYGQVYQEADSEAVFSIQEAAAGSALGINTEGE